MGVREGRWVRERVSLYGPGEGRSIAFCLSSQFVASRSLVKSAVKVAPTVGRGVGASHEDDRPRLLRRTGDGECCDGLIRLALSSQGSADDRALLSVLEGIATSIAESYFLLY